MVASSSFVLTGATIVTMNESFDIIEGDLTIKSGRIESIGPSRRDPEAKVVDCSSMVIIPGFVQTHIHLCQTLLRNHADDLVLIDWLRDRVWPYEAALTYEDLKTSARWGLAELALSGTTTILDMGTVRHTDAIGEAVSDSGIRAFIGKCMMDLREEVPDGLYEDTASSIAESLRLLQAWNGAADGRIRYAFAPRFAVSCSERLLAEVSEAAADLDVFIHTHSSETAFENEFTQRHYGCSNLDFLERVGMTGERSVFAHGVHVSDEECELLARTRTVIAHCPSSNLKLASGIANMPRYDAHGVRVSLGADGAPCNNNLDAFMEMRLAALIQKPIHGPTAMPARRVLQLATIDGARALGIEDEIGSLEVGKFADLTVLDLSNDFATGPAGDVYSRIVYAAGRHCVRDVFASGRPIVRQRELVNEDKEALLARGRESIQSVLGRM